MSKDDDLSRVEKLENALLEYVARYGATDLAVDAFRDVSGIEQRVKSFESHSAKGDLRSAYKSN
ncbi:hypothetical protein [Gymnodinialimonas sp. 57CJ19]|uniref:hypothetical protein n=1 Tax=Gymnodinialimonas sp. 57CJ19 TaxID=3138498 RepID=UPI0031342FAD